MLAIVRNRVDQRNITYAYLDGQTTKRREVVERFQTDAKDPVEVKILQLQDQKRNLSEAIVSADNSLLRNLTSEDLMLLLS